MPEGRARVTAELAGANQVVSGLKSIGTSIATLGHQGMASLGMLNKFSLSGAIDSAKALTLQTAKLSQQAGRSSSDLRAQFERLESSALAPAEALAGMTNHLGRITYDTKYAVSSMEGLGDAALASGREIEDMQGIGAGMKFLGATDASAELGRLRDMADRLNTVGGPVALYDTIAALGPQLDQVAKQGDKSRARVEALIAVAGKGRSPAQQQQVASGLLEVLRSRAMDLERVTGKRQLDEHGDMLDPLAMAQELQRRALKANAGNQAAARRGLINAYGHDVGSFLANSKFDEVEQLANQAKNTGANKADADRFRDTDAAKRIRNMIQDLAAKRDLGNAGASIQDKIDNAMGARGKLAATFANEALTGAVDLLPGDLKNNKLIKPAIGLTSSAIGYTANVALEAAAAAPRPLVDAKTRVAANQSQTIGQEIARQAQQQGDLMPVIGKAGGDQATITAALLALEKVMDRLPDRLADQVSQGMQAQLGRTPIYARVQRNPSDQAVN